MKKILNLFATLLIVAMVMPSFVGCSSDDADSNDTTNGDVTVDDGADTDGDGNADITSDALTPDEQKSTMQAIATSFINTLDVNSTKPILAALDAMIERLDDVEAPEQLQYMFEFEDDDEDYAVDVVEPYYDVDDEIYYTQYTAAQITPLASLRDIVAGDISALNNFATISTKSDTKEMDLNTLSYLADAYGTYTLNSDDTWTYAEASNAITIIVDNYKLTMNISGNISTDIEYTERHYDYTYNDGNYTDVLTTTEVSGTITIPQSVSVTFASNGTTLAAIEANVSELDAMAVKATASATATFADFTVTTTNVIGDGSGSLANEISYNGTSLMKVSAAYAGLDADSMWDAIDDESDEFEMGGVKVSCEVLGGQLCLTGTISDLGDFVTEMNTIDDKYDWSTYDEETNTYTYGFDEGYCTETIACLSNYLDIYWGFGSASNVQGKIEFDYEFDSEKSSFEYWNGTIRTEVNNEYSILPILVFGDDSRIDIESFFTESSFSTVIDSAMDLVDDMTTLMEDYSNLL